MIFGKTYDQRLTPKHWFAWHPVKLDDGRTVWLQRVWRWRNHTWALWHYVLERPRATISVNMAYRPGGTP